MVAVNPANRLLGRWKPYVAVFVPIVGVVLVTNAIAESTATEFNIPALPVSSALGAYARQGNVHFFIMTEGLDAIQTNAMVGSYDPQHALQLLLAGTGIQAEHWSDATVQLGRWRKSS